MVQNNFPVFATMNRLATRESDGYVAITLRVMS